MHTTQLITPQWLLPMQRATQHDTPPNASEHNGQILYDHSVVMVDDKIHDILPTATAITKYQGLHVELPGQVLMPGLINMHTHIAMNLYRGMADDLPLMSWLNDYIWPAEQATLSADSVRLGSQLAIAEMLRAGITCFNDHYFYPDITAEVVEETGIRACLGAISLDVANSWGKDADHMLQQSLDAMQRTPSSPRLRWALAPHSPYMLNDSQLKQVATAAQQNDLPVHIHLHETLQEIEHNLTHYKMRPIERLQKLGLINERLIAVHMVHLNPEEIKLIATTGVHVVHCPEANLKLASGVMPYAALAEAQVNISLGTDGAVSNNDLDMLAEAHTAALLHKGAGAQADPTLLSAKRALQMATINAAHALGWQQHIGSLEIGKQADIISIDLQHVNSQPVYDPISQLIYACQSQQVSNVWVAGKQLLKNGQHTTMDLDKIMQQSQLQANRIKQAIK